MFLMAGSRQGLAGMEASPAQLEGSVSPFYTNGSPPAAGWQQQSPSGPASSWLFPWVDAALLMSCLSLRLGLQPQMELKAGSCRCHAGCGAGICCTSGQVSWSQLYPRCAPCPSVILLVFCVVRQRGALLLASCLNSAPAIKPAAGSAGFQQLFWP